MINQECDSVEKKINSHRQFAADRFISSDKRFTFRTSKEYIPVKNTMIIHMTFSKLVK